MMREKATDALLSAAIKSIEELEGLVAMLENLDADGGPGRLVSKLREIANLFDKLPLLAGDLNTIKRRLRGMLSTDPDKTPRAISVKDIPAVTISITPERETRFEQVENPYRTQTQRGIGSTKPPLPKKTPT